MYPYAMHPYERKCPTVKQKLLLLAAAILLVALAGCSPAPQAVAADGLYRYLIERSAQAVDTLTMLASSEAYIRYHSLSDEIGAEVAKMNEATQDEPLQAIVIECPDQAVLDGFAAMIDDADATLSEELSQFLAARLVLTLPSQVTAQQGVEVLAATSIVTVSESFLSHSDLKENTLVVFLYDSDYAVCTSFRPSLENTVIATSNYVKLGSELYEALIEGSLAAFGEVPEGIEISYFTAEAMKNLK